MSIVGYADDYWRPREPCNSCSVQELDCIVHRSHGQSCYPCVILSRQCQVQPVSESSIGQSSLGIGRDTEGDDPGDGSSQIDSSELPITRSSSRSRSRNRLSSVQVSILEDWAQTNGEHPYPTELEKLALQQQTSLSYTQVCNWFTNYRRKRKATLQKERNSQLTAQHQIVRPIQIQAPAAELWESLDPLQRWRQSPPEVEPATLDDISAALGTAGILQGSGQSEDTASTLHSYVGSDPDSTSLWMSCLVDRVPSVASGNSLDSRFSGESLSSHSTASARIRPGTPRFRRRNRRKKPCNSSDSKDRRFQCTFCTDRFKTKFDWVRHEKTLHLSLESWTCPGASPGEFQRRISTIPTCVFCDSEDTSAEHYTLHNPTSCASIFDKPGTGCLLFFRKDHLQQHLRIAHNTQNISNSIQTYWKSEITDIRSRCGFCNANFTTWNERVTHLAQEFRNGAQMKNWEGSRGFDTEVEARATLSMPPYLIDVDTKTQTPFSASDPWSVLHHANLFPNQRRVNYLSGATDSGEDYIENPLDHLGTITYWEKIDFELGRWAQAKMQEGVDITDQMIQEQARLMVYGNIDPWNQTEADHPQWLAEFKVKYGIHQQRAVSNMPAEFPLFETDRHADKAHHHNTEATQPLGDGLEDMGLEWNSQLANYLANQCHLD